MIHHLRALRLTPDVRRSIKFILQSLSLDYEYTGTCYHVKRKLLMTAPYVTSSRTLIGISYMFKWVVNTSYLYSHLLGYKLVQNAIGLSVTMSAYQTIPIGIRQFLILLGTITAMEPWFHLSILTLYCSRPCLLASLDRNISTLEKWLKIDEHWANYASYIRYLRSD